MTITIKDLDELHADARRCAEHAGLVYVEAADPGWRRRRRGNGFSYLDHRGRPLTDAEIKVRLAALAIPPAWTKVWICPDPGGHILATGEDERGRKQYIYHPQWRALRDLINFYRLILIGDCLPTVRAHVTAQLRRRTLDRDRVIAGMLAILDSSLIRIGSEIYAEENDSVGLTTLGPEHVHLTARAATLSFRAKSGKDADLTLTDSSVVRLLRELVAVDGERLFAVDGAAIDADEVNRTIAGLTGEHITAKDFRTWGGTLRAFSYLRAHRDEPADTAIVAAVDAAAERLGNTRAVARAHYVHPQVLESAVAGTFTADLQRTRPRRTALLSPDERLLAAFLEQSLAEQFTELSTRSLDPTG
ncbi:DNA topoisomerase IB [Jatrophihabitans sp.]|uniref:DNA topoisomerase IB n=1 Tax=Jatrophihabitans sp. TaxID=1932789 RepID=UPI0030C77F72|nr:topoisomerase [Jatrophihabitans sp.]